MSSIQFPIFTLIFILIGTGCSPSKEDGFQAAQERDSSRDVVVQFQRSPEKKVDPKFEIEISTNDCEEAYDRPPKSQFYYRSHLVTAIITGNAPCVKKIINIGKMDVNTPLANKPSEKFALPIHIALEYRNIRKAKFFSFSVVKVLLEAGVETNTLTPEGDTLLNLATKYSLLKNTPEVAQYLIYTEKFDVNAADESGYSPIHRIVKMRQTQTLEMLLSESPKVDVLSPNGDSPLLAAIRSNWIVGAELLLKQKPNLEIADPKGNTALHLATIKSLFVFSKKLIENMPSKLINKTNNKGWTALNMAVYKNSSVAQNLIKAGADVNIPNGNKELPLHWAIAAQNSTIIAKLIEKTSVKNLNLLTSGEWTPLGIAVRNSDNQSLQMLIDKGVDVNTKIAGQTYPLHMAAKLNFVTGIHSLVKAGADVNQLDEDLLTPLAYNQHSKDVVEALLAGSFNPSKINAKGFNPLFSIWSSEAFKTVLTENPNLDLNKGVDEDGNNLFNHMVLRYLEASYHQDWTLDIIEQIIQNGGDVNQPLPNGDSILFPIVKKQEKGAPYFDEALWALLMKSNIKLNLENKVSKTVLFYADTPEEAQILMNGNPTTKESIDLTTKDLTGQTAQQNLESQLESYTLDYQETNEQITELLKKKSAAEEPSQSHLEKLQAIRAQQQQEIQRLEAILELW